MYSWGQNANTQKALVVDKIEKLDSAVDKNALYVIDGELSDNKLNNIKPTDIFSIDILKKGEKNSDTSLETMRDVVIVVTNAGAIKNYQRKFSAFSKEYIKYITLYNHNDENFQYEIDDEIVQGNRNMIVEKLYKIPAKKIKKISVQGLVLKGDHNIEPRVTITTKQ
jgi:hypothetical protein